MLQVRPICETPITLRLDGFTKVLQQQHTSGQSRHRQWRFKTTENADPSTRTTNKANTMQFLERLSLSLDMLILRSHQRVLLPSAKYEYTPCVGLHNPALRLILCNLG